MTAILTHDREIVRYRRTVSRSGVHWLKDPWWQKGYEFNGYETDFEHDIVVHEVNEKGAFLRHHSIQYVERV